jgi:hypothetical protein
MMDFAYRDRLRFLVTSDYRSLAVIQRNQKRATINPNLTGKRREYGKKTDPGGRKHWLGENIAD